MGKVFSFFFFSPALLFSRRKVIGCRAVLLGSLQAQTVFILASLQLFFGREGVSPHLPLLGWEAPGRHSWAGVGEELAEGWEISVKVVVGGKIFKQETRSEGRGCCMGKEDRPAGHPARAH